MSPDPSCTSYEIVNHSGNRFSLTYYSVDNFLDEKWLDPKSDFSSMFQASVKNGLRNTLGETVTLTRLPLLKQTLQSCAEKPGEFHRELQFYFGFGALTLERMIVKDLFQKLNLHYPSNNELDFETSIGLARKDLASIQRRSR
jgi:hypothetical protein